MESYREADAALLARRRGRGQSCLEPSVLLMALMGSKQMNLESLVGLGLAMSKLQ